MNFLKLFLGDNSAQNTNNSVASLLDTHLLSTDALPENYYELFIGQQQDLGKKISNFEEIILKIQKLTTSQAIIKGLTIIFKVISNNQYQHQFLQKLQLLENPSFTQLEQLNCQWVRDLFVCCKSYLMRLTSVSQVFQRSTNLQKSNKECLNFRSMLNDLYLILNTVGLLFPYSTNAINTIGRYYIKTNKYYNEFYKVLREPLVKSYKYMKVIVDSFIRDHKKCQTSQLQCFMHTLPEIQLMCDKIEQILLNKYFKGSGPSQKLYLKQEQIEEVAYHLKHKQGLVKDNDSTEQAQEQQFGQYI